MNQKLTCIDLQYLLKINRFNKFDFSKLSIHLTVSSK